LNTLSLKMTAVFSLRLSDASTQSPNGPTPPLASAPRAAHNVCALAAFHAESNGSALPRSTTWNDASTSTCAGDASPDTSKCSPAF
jgi:hypothetical protein